jgi:hypothetical protein
MDEDFAYTQGVPSHRHSTRASVRSRASSRKSRCSIYVRQRWRTLPLRYEERPSHSRSRRPGSWHLLLRPGARFQPNTAAMEWAMLRYDNDSEVSSAGRSRLYRRRRPWLLRWPPHWWCRHTRHPPTSHTPRPSGRSSCSSRQMASQCPQLPDH